MVVGWLREKVIFSLWLGTYPAGTSAFSVSCMLTKVWVYQFNGVTRCRCCVLKRVFLSHSQVVMCALEMKSVLKF